MKQYLNFNYRNVRNYSLQHYVSEFFKRVELILVLALSIAFLIASKTNKNFSNNVSFAFVNISLPIVKIAAFPFNTAISLLIDFEELIAAKKENEILKEENTKLRALQIEALNFNNENKQLKNMLGFASVRSAQYVMAKISGRTHGLFNQNLFLNVGKDRNIKEGNIVTGATGMIGRVVDVGDNKSRLMLVNDANSHIPIIASKARARGILVGNGTNLMKITYLSKNHQIKVGDLIFTSGDGDTLMPAIIVGVVRKVDGQNVGVEMIEDINNADIVTIMQY